MRFSDWNVRVTVRAALRRDVVRTEFRRGVRPLPQPEGSGRRLVVAVLIGLAALAPLAASPASAGRAQRVDRMFSRWGKPDTPDVILAVVRDGETIDTSGYGLAALEHGIPMSPDQVSAPMNRARERRSVFL